MKVFHISKSIFLFVLISICLNACKKDDDFNEGPFISKRKAILSFSFNALDPPVNGIINYQDSIVNLLVPFGTNLTQLVPTITISEKATISPPSGIANDFTDTIEYIVTAEDGTTQVWKIIVTEAEEGVQARLRLSNPVWELSPAGTGIPAFFSPDGERGLDYGNGHVYITSNNDKVLILNAASGELIGNLAMTGVVGGEPKIADIEVSDNGAILACNSVEWTSANGGPPTTFKIYKWDSETSVPTVFLSYTNTQYRMGDSFTVVGDITGDAVIMTTFGRKFLEPTTRGNIVFKWTVTAGVLNPEPELIEIMQVPTLTKFGSRPHAQMLRADSETLYINANDIDFTQSNLDGTFVNRIPNGGRQLYDGFTSYFEIFEIAGKTVLATAFPRSSVESRLLVIDITKGLDQVTTADVILSKNFLQGSGEIANVNASGAVAINKIDNNNVEIYCLITNQALAKFTLTTSFD